MVKTHIKVIEEPISAEDSSRGQFLAESCGDFNYPVRFYVEFDVMKKGWFSDTADPINWRLHPFREVKAEIISNARLEETIG